MYINIVQYVLYCNVHLVDFVHCTVSTKERADVDSFECLIWLLQLSLNFLFSNIFSKHIYFYLM